MLLEAQSALREYCFRRPRRRAFYRVYMPFDVSIPEMLVLVVVVLLLFGPKRAPEMGRSLAKNIRELRNSISGLTGATSLASSPEPSPRETVDLSDLGSASPNSQPPSAPAQERETIL